jgi:D-glycero-alpha-D-manno-heptose-7-phosphate kinase
MIISKTPLRLSFVGGGTDFEDFYRQYPGRVLSTSIDKYIYLGINPKFDGQIRVSYSQTENVPHRNDVAHPIVKAALEESGIENGVEIVSIADIPAKGTGLGSSSSFTVGLLKALHHHQGKDILPHDLARLACHIEINKLGSPIGRQDQYAAAFGGLNVVTFNPDGSVMVEPITLPEKIKEDFQNHMLTFYTGIERQANGVLLEQKQNIAAKFEFLKKMSDMVLPFKEALLKGNFQEMGNILHQNWLLKKELASGISNAHIDQIYQKALAAGAYGGKILGAGGGGFLLVLAPPQSHQAIKAALADYKNVSFKFSDGGSSIVLDH